MKPRTSAVIVNYEGGDLLTRCVKSLLAQQVPVEIIVVDNGSVDGSVARVSQTYPVVRVISMPANVGFAEGANEGSRHAGGEFLLFLNPDTRLDPGCLPALESAFENDEHLGVCGPTIFQEACGWIEYGSTIDVLGTPVGLRTPEAPFYVSGCALMTKADLFSRLAGFDSRFFMFMEDVDYCWRVLLLGRDVNVVEGARCEHVGGASAPGGYEVDDQLETTTFRLGLRERNALAMLIKCAPALSLFWVVPMYVVQSLATIAVLFASGQPRAAKVVIEALYRNVAWLGGSLERRRRVRSSTVVADRVARRRMRRSVTRLSLLRRVGVPRVLAVEPNDADRTDP